jgi:hypothetical protein
VGSDPILVRSIRKKSSTRRCRTLRAIDAGAMQNFG